MKVVLEVDPQLISFVKSYAANGNLAELCLSECI